MDLITPLSLGEYVPPSIRSSTLCVSDVVERALIEERKGLHAHEQRTSDRYPLSRLFELTPWDIGANQAAGDTLAVVSRNLSLDGLGFYHRDALTARHAIVQLSPGSDHPALLMKLEWCRFLRPDWYDNGGRFIRIARTAA